MLIQEQVSLAPLTTFGIGGPARYFAEAANADDLREAIAFAREHDAPIFVLGGGSNVLVADEGFPGLVIKAAMRGVEQRGNRLTAGAGEDWDRLVAYSVQLGLAGLECMSGIPGSVGATPVQNVGAYGQEVSATIVQVEAIDTTSCELRIFSNAECEFAYRTSLFNTTARGRFIITRVTFELRPGGMPNISYRDLKEHFGGRTPTLTETREAVLAIRRSKGMLLKNFTAEDAESCAEDAEQERRGQPANDDDMINSCSAGSFFKNPVLHDNDFAELHGRAAARGIIVPSYPGLTSQHKVPAAWLVEQAGFPKGFTCGLAGISSKHALAIVNRGGARAADVIALKDQIQRAVLEQFGIQLQPEPVFLGFDEGAASDRLFALGDADTGIPGKGIASTVR